MKGMTGIQSRVTKLPLSRQEMNRKKLEYSDFAKEVKGFL